jgi:putative inorganic carbon (hco3(-)) transporter
VRDILLGTVMFGALPFILRSPRFGVMMWIWLSVMNPHRLTWGSLYDFPFVAVVACLTMASCVFSKDLRRPPVQFLTIVLVLFVLWTGVTTMFAISPDDSFEKWKTLVKTQVVTFLIPMLFHKKEDLRKLVWVIALCVAYFGTKGGFWILATGGGERVYGPPESYIEDNNALAVAVIMMIPLLRYLQLTSPKKIVRWMLSGMMLLCGVAAIGSYSRGALLAAVCMSSVLWIKGRRKLPILLALLVSAPIVLSVMPDKWFERMDTLNTYEQDDSAMARFNSWATMWNLATDRPLVGGGFVVDTSEVYLRYSPKLDRKPQVAHSIYFQALGEHGFVGLGLYLLLLYGIWRTASQMIRISKERADCAWAHDLSAMMQVTLVGFAVGGAFLSLVNFDVPYYLIGAMIAAKQIVDRSSRPESARAPVASREARSSLATD